MSLSNLIIRHIPVGHVNRILYPEIEMSDIFVTKPDILEEAKILFTAGNIGFSGSRNENQHFCIGNFFSSDIFCSVAKLSSQDYMGGYHCSCEFHQTNEDFTPCSHVIAVFMKIRDVETTDDSSADYISYGNTNDETDYYDNDTDNSFEGPFLLTMLMNNPAFQFIINAQPQRPQPHVEDKQVFKLNVKDSLVYPQITCQICFEIMQRPVIMPCRRHSMCLSCTKQYLQTKFDDQNCIHHQYLHGQKIKIYCPTCRTSGGYDYYSTPQEIKVNIELENVIKAYENEINEKFQKTRKNYLNDSKEKDSRDQQAENSDGLIQSIEFIDKNTFKIKLNKDLNIYNITKGQTNDYNELTKQKEKKIPNDIEKLMKEIYMQPRKIQKRQKKQQQNQ